MILSRVLINDSVERQRRFDEEANNLRILASKKKIGSMMFFIKVNEKSKTKKLNSEKSVKLNDASTNDVLSTKSVVVSRLLCKGNLVRAENEAATALISRCWKNSAKYVNGTTKNWLRTWKSNKNSRQYETDFKG